MPNASTFPAVLDATMLASYRCPRRFNLAHVQHYGSPGGKSIHLIAGGAYAKGLEVARLAYMNDRPPGEGLLLGIDALIKEYGDAQPGADHRRLDQSRPWRTNAGSSDRVCSNTEATGPGLDT